MDTFSVEDDGVIEITVKTSPEDKKPVTINLDLYEAFNTFFEIRKQFEGRGIQENPAIRDYLLSKGFPTLSDRACVKIADVVFKKVDELKKKDGNDESAESPDSTESTPGRVLPMRSG